ncbi:MAG: hypothetical protein DMD68_14280 [Gemmatimonadetes bacterium]|nr:MAG: hypothetical protein DMD68_14280 [Gemmatimonadota bacterium]
MPRRKRRECERYDPQSRRAAGGLPRGAAEGVQGRHAQGAERDESDGDHECDRDPALSRRHRQRRRVLRLAVRRCDGRQVHVAAQRREEPLTFPEGYKESFTKYHTISFPATKQVRYYYANKTAVTAAKAGKPLPDGSVLFAEVYAAKLGADGKPATGADGNFVAEKIVAYTAMAREAGWGNDIPEMLRNENWNYAVFTADKQHRPGVNHAECLACHKPLDNVSYTFTLKQLAGAK